MAWKRMQSMLICRSLWRSSAEETNLITSQSTAWLTWHFTLLRQVFWLTLVLQRVAWGILIWADSKPTIQTDHHAWVRNLEVGFDAHHGWRRQVDGAQIVFPFFATTTVSVGIVHLLPWQPSRCWLEKLMEALLHVSAVVGNSLSLIQILRADREIFTIMAVAFNHMPCQCKLMTGWKVITGAYQRNVCTVG